MPLFPNQRSFKDSPVLISSLFELLETSFPGISKTRVRNSGLGVNWEDDSVPFVHFEDSKPVSHVGVIGFSVCLNGTLKKVGGIHAVCTHPEYRRKGYFRKLIKEALTFCERKYDGIVLFTEKPELYTPFGFSVVQESVFQAPFKSKGCTTEGSFRLLNLDNKDDLRILHRVIDDRVPVSDTVGICSAKGVFFFNESSSPLYYSKNLDAISVFEISEDGHLKLFDVVGSRKYNLQKVLKQLNGRINKVSIYFSPDRLEVSTISEAILFNNDSYLMVKGSLDFPSRKFMWPRTARC